jgi:phosphoglycerate dehydrogenase-like enzyme
MFDRGIRVICGNEFFAESVAEGCIAYMLSALRMIPDQATALKNEKRWKGANGQLVEDRGLLNKTVGIVSFGAISKYLVEMLQVFHCKIKLYSRRPLDEEYCRAKNIEQASMEEIFSTCDIISIQTAYNEHTHHMINRDLLKLIKPGALFLNTSRGKVIDELALIEELKDGRFTAFLDVYDQEPPAPENELFNLPNVYMMPHRGGPTIDRRPVIAENLFREAYAYVNDPTSPLRDEITREKAATMTNR